MDGGTDASVGAGASDADDGVTVDCAERETDAGVWSTGEASEC